MTRVKQQAMLAEGKNNKQKLIIDNTEKAEGVTSFLVCYNTGKGDNTPCRGASSIGRLFSHCHNIGKGTIKLGTNSFFLLH